MPSSTSPALCEQCHLWHGIPPLAYGEGASCLTPLPEPLPQSEFLPGFLQIAQKKPVSKWWQYLLLSQTFPGWGQPPRALCPLYLSTNALRLASSPHCHTQAFLGSCSLQVRILCLIASCYKLFKRLQVHITFSTHILKHVPHWAEWRRQDVNMTGPLTSPEILS